MVLVIESVEASGRLGLVGIIAMAKAERAKRQMLAMFEAGHEMVSNAELLTCGLRHESLRGFIAGVMLSLKMLDGVDPIEEFDAFMESLDDAEKGALEHAFSREVERYSETGEA